MKRNRGVVKKEKNLLILPPSIPRDLQYLLLSYYLLHTEFSQFEIYQLIKYIGRKIKNLPLSVRNAFEQLEKLLPLEFGLMQSIFLDCNSNMFFNDCIFSHIAKLYKHDSKPHNIIPCYVDSCSIINRVNNCALHNHDGLITYFGHSIPFKSFVSGFKTEINKWRKKVIHSTF